MSKLIGHAKLTPPETGSLVVRQRLFDALDRISPCPLIWICAPAGSGKTSLAAGYARHRGQPLIWYELDETDNDPAAFFGRLFEAAKPLLEGHSDSMPTLETEDQENLAGFTALFLERLVERLPASFLLVLDNCHCIEDNWFNQADFLKYMSRLPAEVTTIITSRSLPPKSSIRLRLEQRMHVLVWHDLRFSKAEAKALLGPEAFPDDVFDLLLKKTGGWAAGLALLGASLQRGGQVAEVTPWLTLHEVFGYCDVEVFRKVKPALQDFLLKSSFLPVMTAELAGEITGCKQAEEVLRGLFQDNLLIERRDLPDPEYAYHPLFILFLQSKVKSAYTPGELEDLRRRAAMLLESSGRIDQAASVLASMDDPGPLEEFILRHAESLIVQVHHVALERWIARLPAGSLHRQPWLAYWQAACRQVDDPQGSRALYRQAFEAFRRLGDEKGLLLSWCGAVDTFIHAWSDFLGLEEWIALMQALTDQGLIIPCTDLGVRTRLTMSGAVAFLRPEQGEVVSQWLGPALEQIGRHHWGAAHHLACFHAAHQAMWMGDLQRLQVVAEIAQRSMDPAESPVLHQLNGICQDALVQSLCLARPDLARQVVDKGLELACRHNQTLWNFILLGMGVFAGLTAGDPASARGYLARMERCMPRSRLFARAHYHHMAASYHMYCENHVQAGQEACKALELAGQSGAVFARPYFALALAQTCHELGEHDECMRNMEIVDGFVAGSTMLQTMSLVCRAYFALGRDGQDQGLAFLRKAFSLGRKQGYVNMLYWWRPKVMARLCVAALENGIEEEYARHLIRHRKLFPETPPVEITRWPWMFRIRTMGRFELTKDGEVVSLRGKIQHKPLALLKLLAGRGEVGLSEAEVDDILWPGSDGDRAHSSFTSTLSRLRKLMRDSQCIVVQGGKVFLDPRRCWVDAWAFRRLCDRLEGLACQFEAAGKAIQRDSGAARMIRQAWLAHDLYRGHFLAADQDLVWTISVRERLRGRYIQLVTRFGRVLERAGDLEQARRWYRQALDVDDLQEEFYRGLMRCAHRRNQPEEAQRLFQICRERLESELNIQPSPKTRALALSLSTKT